MVKLFEIYQFSLKIFTHFPYNRWDKNRKCQVPDALIQFDLHSFDQNILSFEDILF